MTTMASPTENCLDFLTTPSSSTPRRRYEITPNPPLSSQAPGRSQSAPHQPTIPEPRKDTPATNPTTSLPQTRRPRGPSARNSLAAAFASKDGGAVFMPASPGSRASSASSRRRLSPPHPSTTTNDLAHRPSSSTPSQHSPSRGADTRASTSPQRADSIISLPSSSSLSHRSHPSSSSSDRSSSAFSRTSSTSSASSTAQEDEEQIFSRHPSESSISTTTTIPSPDAATSTPPSSKPKPKPTLPTLSHHASAPAALPAPNTPAFAALSTAPFLSSPAGYAPIAAGFARLAKSSSLPSASAARAATRAGAGMGVVAAGTGQAGGEEKMGLSARALFPAPSPPLTTKKVRGLGERVAAKA